MPEAGGIYLQIQTPSREARNKQVYSHVRWGETYHSFHDGLTLALLRDGYHLPWGILQFISRLGCDMLYLFWCLNGVDKLRTFMHIVRPVDLSGYKVLSCGIFVLNGGDGYPTLFLQQQIYSSRFIATSKYSVFSIVFALFAYLLTSKWPPEEMSLLQKRR
jgi:hypothetical protein